MLNTKLYNINTGKVPVAPLVSPLVSVVGFETVPKPNPSRLPGRLTTSSRRKIDVRADATQGAETTDVGAQSRRAQPLRAIVTVHKSFHGLLPIGLNGDPRHSSDNSVGERLILALVSTDPKSLIEPFYATKVREDEHVAIYEASHMLRLFWGEIGAVLVENEHHKEMYLQNIRIYSARELEITCNSWVHSKHDNPEKRIFFTNKSYLPSQTPDGLVKYRAWELQQLTGNGQGERKWFERIYDYDTYNDLGDPDTDIQLKRPVLGGPAHPYPRRCRTGRPPTLTDPLFESRDVNGENYVPRDEKFSDVKQISFSANIVYAVLESLLPTLEGVTDPTTPFPFFTAIDTLFDEGIKIPNVPHRQRSLKEILPQLVRSVDDSEVEALLRFDTPAAFFSDRFGWLKDEEFGRQTLAGLNPLSIQLVTEWPLRSNLDPVIYGPPESAITTELVQRQIGGIMTVEEAIRQKKLFIIDYHDAFLPYVNRVRALGKGTTMYGSRTLFSLMPDDTLKPIAIELVRPPSDDGSKLQWKQVYTPTGGSTAAWLWKFAKAHAVANDSGFHQLVSHWLRTHACSEPYAIATNRQLSVLHPIHRLLRPHFRYTLEINAIGRITLISAGGSTETSFSPGKYSMEISSEVYKAWRFDKESLPADLINRGMATEDPSAPHGLRLTIEDYPYASDGLLIWDCIKEWVTTYVNHYYPHPQLVQWDIELQNWWAEIRLRGHEDKKDEPWWPKLETPDDLIGILTTMIWVASAHHAAVNFGQYAYAGYFPNRPTIARNKMPTEDPTEEERRLFIEKPEVALLRSFPSQLQATRVMSILYVLSTHSPDEEYLGEKAEPAWLEDPVIRAAFERFSGRLKEIERIVDERNVESGLNNRSGAGVVPYELLKPFSEPGVTSKGVPNSISI